MNTQAKGKAKFDVNKFASAKFVPRTEEVHVPGLADFFEGEGDPVWIVRGLTANELASANDAASRSSTLDSIVKAMTSSSKSDQVEQFRKALGVSDDINTDIIKRIEQFVAGSVEPVVDKSFAVRFAEAYPIEFYDLTNRILALSGKGMKVLEGKLKPSGETQESET